MSGGDIFARFQFSADAVTYAKARSRKHPEVTFEVLTNYGRGVLYSCTKSFKEGRRIKD
jgi:hypothetical protein